MNYYLEALKKYTVFNGRARRKEYWMFALCNLIIGLALVLLGAIVKNPMSTLFSILSFLYSLAVVVPSIAVFVRRLHDTNHSGWWFFIGFIPLVGMIVLLIFMVRDGTPGENRYGPNPKEVKVV